MSTTAEMKKSLKVSVHGGHSGQFCTHAKDTLEEVIQAYIAQGFSWVGITEHMPPVLEKMRYQDEIDASLSTEEMMTRFERYFEECRKLQKKYISEIEIMTSFETETYKGSLSTINEIMARVQPDYLVGSVHHVADIAIDYSESLYLEAVVACGSLKQLYCDYFDAQYAMLQDLRPAVVGHFDLIRIYDKGYIARLQEPEVWEKVERNLSFIAKEGLILDFNLRGFDKAVEQYPCTPILKLAQSKGILIAPGDDSHGVSSVGRNYEKGLEILIDLGFDTNWPKPKPLSY